MPKPTVFAGLKLSKDVSRSVDQRLFYQEPPANEAAPTDFPLSQEVGKEGSREITKLPSQPPRRPEFDLSLKPYRKDSFLFTSEEWEGLEDVKLALRRTFDVDATKNDLARCALHSLIEDFHTRGADSIAVRRLSGKGGK